MLDVCVSLIEKIIDWLISLRVKPTIKVIKFTLKNSSVDNKQRVSFEAIVSNNSNKCMSISEKYLCFYRGKEELNKISVTRYEIVRKRDGFDELNILTPIDDIITLQPGESKKIWIIDEKENLSLATNIIFTYYTGRRTYKFKLDQSA